MNDGCAARRGLGDEKRFLRLFCVDVRLLPP